MRNTAYDVLTYERTKILGLKFLSKRKFEIRTMTIETFERAWFGYFTRVQFTSGKVRLFPFPYENFVACMDKFRNLN